MRDRLEDLQGILDDADLPNVPIREIVATLLLFAEEQGAELRKLIEDYRNAPLGQAAIGGLSAGGKVVPFRRRRPGRPPKL